MNEELFDELVGKIYDAAADPDLWPVFLDKFAEAVSGLRGTTIALTYFSAPAGCVSVQDRSLFRFVHHDPAWLDAYARYFCTVNVLADESLLLEGKAMTTQQVLADADLVKTEYYNDFLKPQDCFYGIGGVVFKKGNAGALFTSFRSKQEGAFGPAELRLYKRLIPHLRRACSIHMKLAEVHSLRRTNTEILDRLSIGVVLLDQNGRAVLLNRAAETLARRGDGFHLDPAGRCRAESPQDTQALRKLIADATGGTNGGTPRRGGTMALARRCSPHPLSVTVSPLPGEAAPLLDHAPGAVLFLCDPDSRTASAEELLARLYGLSPAETRLAAALAGGDSVKEYAEAHGVSLNTVRTQLKQVLAKTGARRQAELVRRVLGGTAFLGAVDGLSMP